MSAKVANPVLVTGPTDEVLAVDGRGKSAKETLAKSASAPNTLSETPQDSAAVQISTALVQKQLLKKITNPKISDDKAQQRLESSMSTRLVDMFGDDSNASNNVVQRYQKDLTGRRLDGIRGDKDQLVKMYRKTDPTSAKSLANAVSKLTGDKGTLGWLDTKSGFSTGLELLNKAIDMGIPDLIDDMMEYLENNREAKRRLIDSVRSVIIRGDLDTLEKIFGYIGASGILQRVPEAIMLLLASYRIPPRTETTEYQGIRTKLLSLLNQIDPNWATTPRNNVEVSDLAATNYASRDVRKLLMLPQPGTTDANIMEQPHFIEAMLAGQYRNQSLEELTAKMYPELKIWVFKR